MAVEHVSAHDHRFTAMTVRECRAPEPDRFTRHGHRFGDRHGALLITCPLCGAWVGSHDGLRWVCDDGHVIWPTFGATA